MSNVSGPIQGVIPLEDTLTSASVVTLITSQLAPYITSASAVTLVSPYLTSASAITLVAPYITSASVVSKYTTIAKVIETTTGIDGGTVSIAAATDIFYLSNGAFTALAIQLPSAPVTNKLYTIAAKSAIVAVSLVGGTIVGTVTALAAGGFATYINDGTKWIRVS